MKIDYNMASDELSKMNLRFDIDNLNIDVLYMRVMQLKGPWVIGRHIHSTYELHYVRSGCCTVVLDDDEFEVGAGYFYITPPGVHHQQCVLTPGDHVEYCLNCDLSTGHGQETESSKILKVLSKMPCKSFKDSFGALEYFEEALEEACCEYIGRHTKIKNLITMILIATVRAFNTCICNKYDVPVKNSDDYRFDQIQKFIEDNIYNPISIQDIAAYMCLSDRQVCRIVERSSGISTKELLMAIKLKRAKMLLKESKLPIKQISDMLGFSSEYYFSQFFKRMEGYSPVIYRNSVDST